MRCDCTGEPPGELMTIAIALAFFTAKARSRSFAVVASVMPGESGVENPIAPVRRTTGTVGVPRRKRRNLGVAIILTVKNRSPDGLRSKPSRGPANATWTPGLALRARPGNKHCSQIANAPIGFLQAPPHRAESCLRPLSSDYSRRSAQYPEASQAACGGP